MRLSNSVQNNIVKTERKTLSYVPTAGTILLPDMVNQWHEGNEELGLKILKAWVSINHPNESDGLRFVKTEAKVASYFLGKRTGPLFNVTLSNPVPFGKINDVSCQQLINKFGPIHLPQSFR